MSDNATVKAVAYIRVSTREQDENNQLDALTKYAKNNGFKIERVFVDKGVSGLKAFQSRNGASEMLKYLEENPSVKHILVTSIDRIARDSVDLKNTIAFFKEKGWKLVSISDKEQFINVLFDENADDVQRLVANILIEILSFYAEFEIKKRRERQLLAWESGKQKGRPPKISDDELLKYIKKLYRPDYSFKTLYAVIRQKYVEDHSRELKRAVQLGKLKSLDDAFVSYPQFLRKLKKMAKEGKIELKKLKINA